MARRRDTTPTTTTTPPSRLPGGVPPPPVIEQEEGESSPPVSPRRQILGNVTTFAGFGSAYGGIDRPFYTVSDTYLPNTLGPEGIFTIQQALYNAGWLDRIEQPGQWTEASRTAFTELLTLANQQGSDWRDILQQSLDAHAMGIPDEFGGGIGTGSGGGRGGGLQPLSIQLPNEDDVRRTVEQNVRDTINIDLGDEAYQHLTDQYMGLYRDVQLRQAEAQRTALMAQEGGTIEFTQPPTVETFVEEKLEEEHPEAVRTADVGDAEAGFVDVMTRSYG
jgi:hypothetical protein